MAVAKWSAPSSESSNIAGTALNSLANGSASGVLADIDGATDQNLYCNVRVDLGSITPAAGGSVALRLRRKRSSTYEDSTNSVIIGNKLLTSGASAKSVDFTVVLPGPFVYGVEVVNYAGVTLASSGNAAYTQAFNEDIS